MSKLKALDENFNLADKRVLLRVDLNVPITNGKVTDKSKINKIVPVIKEFIRRKTKIILISHLGRPEGKIDQKLSLKVIAPILETSLNSKVHFFDESYGSSAIEKSKKINSGEVLLLENNLWRFSKCRKY